MLVYQRVNSSLKQLFYLFGGYNWDSMVDVSILDGVRPTCNWGPLLGPGKK